MLRIYHQEELAKLYKRRPGEVKLGERLSCLAPSETLIDLSAYKEQGIDYVLLGIPESLGPQANLGRAGAERAWSAFLQAFLAQQSNRYLLGSSILMLGHIIIEDLQAQARQSQHRQEEQLQQLRYLVGQIDQRVEQVLSQVFAANLVPIVIGGGHNNAYPIIKAWYAARGKALSCINCDAHADVRPLEGRHSGNSFSYAVEEGLLDHYLAFGLHRGANTENAYRYMEQNERLHWTNLEELSDWETALGIACHRFEPGEPLGVELDMDALADMPSSAQSPLGISLQQAHTFVRQVSDQLSPVYLHLPEAAPEDTFTSRQHVGKALAGLVSTFIMANQH